MNLEKRIAYRKTLQETSSFFDISFLLEKLTISCDITRSITTTLALESSSLTTTTMSTALLLIAIKAGIQITNYWSGLVKCSKFMLDLNMELVLICLKITSVYSMTIITKNYLYIGHKPRHSDFSISKRESISSLIWEETA